MEADGVHIQAAITSAFVAFAALSPVAACARQVVFYDDFDGDALLPHWMLPHSSDWEYDVSNSQLHVTELHYPSDPKSPGNIATMGTIFNPQEDFRLDAWMGWEMVRSPLARAAERQGGCPDRIDRSGNDLHAINVQRSLVAGEGSDKGKGDAPEQDIEVHGLARHESAIEIELELSSAAGDCESVNARRWRGNQLSRPLTEPD